MFEEVLETIEFWFPTTATDLDKSRQPAIGGGGRFFLETFFLSRQFERDAIAASMVFCKEIVIHRGMIPPNQIFFNFEKVAFVDVPVERDPCEILNAQLGHDLGSTAIFAVTQGSVFPVLDRVVILDAGPFPRVDRLSDVILSEKG